MAKNVVQENRRATRRQNGGVPGTQYLSPFAFMAGGRTGVAAVEGAARDSLQARHEPSNRPAGAPSEGDSEGPPPPPRPPPRRAAAASP